jgi:hypothetical protein
VLLFYLANTFNKGEKLMTSIFFYRVTQKRFSLCFIFLLMLLIGGCGSSGGDDPIVCPGDPGCEDQGTDVEMQGTWQGSTDTQAYGDMQTTFTLTQDGGNIGGTLELSGSDGTYRDEDVSGTISNSAVTINAIFPLREGGQVEFSYEGSVTGDTYSGDVKLFQDGTDTNNGGSFTLTKNGQTPDTGTNFSGTYTIYDESNDCLPLAGYRRYSIEIQQNGSQAQLYLTENQSLSCNVDNDQLTCEGALDSGEGWSVNFHEYILSFNGSNELSGSARWEYSESDSNCSGDSELTTILPEYGSLILVNQTDYTFPTLLYAACGTTSWQTARFSPPVEPNTWSYFADRDPTCELWRLCIDSDVSNCSSSSTEVNIYRGETTILRLTSESSAQLLEAQNQELRFLDTVQPSNICREYDIKLNGTGRSVLK